MQRRRHHARYNCFVCLRSWRRIILIKSFILHSQQLTKKNLPTKSKTYGCKSFGGVFFLFFCPASESRILPLVAGMWFDMACCCWVVVAERDFVPLSSSTSKLSTCGEAGDDKAVSSSTPGMLPLIISFWFCNRQWVVVMRSEMHVVLGIPYLCSILDIINVEWVSTCTIINGSYCVVAGAFFVDTITHPWNVRTTMGLGKEVD